MRAFFRDLTIVLLALCSLLAAAVIGRFQFMSVLPATEFGVQGLAGMSTPDLIMIGSSRTRQGYDPAVFSAESCQAYLLGYNGLSPALAVPLIQAAAEEPKNARALWVIEASAHALLHRPVLQDTRLFMQLPPRQKRALLDSMAKFDPNFDSLRSLKLLLRTDNELFLTYPVVRPLLERTSFRGGYIGKQVSALNEEQFGKLKMPAGLLPDAKPNPDQVQGLLQTLEILRSVHARAVFVDPPMPMPLAEAELSQRTRQWLQDFVQTHGGVYINANSLLDGTVADNFADAAHLSGQGRSRLSQALAQRLGEMQLLPCRRNDSQP